MGLEPVADLRRRYVYLCVGVMTRTKGQSMVIRCSSVVTCLNNDNDGMTMKPKRTANKHGRRCAARAWQRIRLMQRDRCIKPIAVHPSCPLCVLALYIAGDERTIRRLQHQQPTSDDVRMHIYLHCSSPDSRVDSVRDLATEMARKCNRGSTCKRLWSLLHFILGIFN